MAAQPCQTWAVTGRRHVPQRRASGDQTMQTDRAANTHASRRARTVQQARLGSTAQRYSPAAWSTAALCGTHEYARKSSGTRHCCRLPTLWQVPIVLQLQARIAQRLEERVGDDVLRPKPLRRRVLDQPFEEARAAHRDVRPEHLVQRVRLDHRVVDRCHPWIQLLQLGRRRTAEDRDDLDKLLGRARPLENRFAAQHLRQDAPVRPNVCQALRFAFSMRMLQTLVSVIRIL